jgi:tRNA(Glu) U13 pseudouridine synthase TruD
MKEWAIAEWETGPIFGYDNKLSPAGTVAAKREIAFMKQHKIGKEFFAIYEKYHIFWLRRLLRVYPKDILFRFQDDDILLQFALPGGTYASILVDELLKITN